MAENTKVNGSITSPMDKVKKEKLLAFLNNLYLFHILEDIYYSD